MDSLAERSVLLPELEEEGDDGPEAFAEHEARGDHEHEPPVRVGAAATPGELEERAEHARDREVGREVHAHSDRHAGREEGGEGVREERLE